MPKLVVKLSVDQQSSRSASPEVRYPPRAARGVLSMLESPRRDDSSVIELEFETTIRASAESVFALIVDLRNYDRWLARSSAFHGTTEISDGPIGVGTTYIESGPTGIRRGKVTEFVRPTRVAFEQPMTMKPAALGLVAIRLGHTLTPAEGSVHLRRTLQLSLSGPVRFARRIVKRQFVVENERMMSALKAFAESEARSS
jgi:uncharacterized protein YndB with AHSA1/START domain